ncbi:hypothetical protein [uncultured Endozoicomonas sp.]|uniref:hypothetical protein n=1 Tax=uncultured Endozoicomonas sp. TaxID=432652 RepID=UPI0026088718|nr:hypothetical protein [uncultured Endozoicomonas sp.]
MINIKSLINDLPSPAQHLLCIVFLLLSFQAKASDKPEITATYYHINSHGNEIRCYTSGNEHSMEQREILLQKGCTLETLSAQEDINVKVTVESNGVSKTLLMSSKYYLMWLGAGIHAINLGRNVPLIITNLLSAQPVPAIGHAIASYFYYIGFSAYAKDTLSPFLHNNYPSTFGENEIDCPIEAWTAGEHGWLLFSDLIMWWNDQFYLGTFDVNRLMVGVDLLNFLIDRFL